MSSMLATIAQTVSATTGDVTLTALVADGVDVGSWTIPAAEFAYAPDMYVEELAAEFLSTCAMVAPSEGWQTTWTVIW